MEASLGQGDLRPTPNLREVLELTASGKSEAHPTGSAWSQGTAGFSVAATPLQQQSNCGKNQSLCQTAQPDSWMMQEVQPPLRARHKGAQALAHAATLHGDGLLTLSSNRPLTTPEPALKLAPPGPSPGKPHHVCPVLLTCHSSLWAHAVPSSRKAFLPHPVMSTGVRCTLHTLMLTPEGEGCTGTKSVSSGPAQDGHSCRVSNW